MTGSTASPRSRRTQQERRAATVAKLVDAAIGAIGEMGYQRATVQEICGRAGLSVGAMFRQFDSRLDLIVRASEEVFARQLAGFRVVMEHLGAQDDSLEVAVRFLRDAQSSNLTHALREIYLAARSDAELRARLEPTVANYYADIIAGVEQTGVLQQFPQHLREPVVFLVLHLFSGEAIVRPVYPRPDLGDTMLPLIEDMLRVYAKSLRTQE